MHGNHGYNLNAPTVSWFGDSVLAKPKKYMQILGDRMAKINFDIKGGILTARAKTKPAHFNCKCHTVK